MNNHSKMFHFHQEDEMFQISSIPYQQHMIQQDLTMGHTSLDGSNLSDNTGWHQEILAPSGNNYEKTNDDNKKIMRKELERQRRQQIATLNSSLRSLLPHEFIKGKHSASDNMNEAVNYIKHQQKKIKELCVKRDELKKLYDSSSYSCGDEISNICSPNCVMVLPYLGGVEIVMSNDFREEGLPLSRVVEILLEEGLDVVSCVSTREKEKFFHTIQSEVSDLTCIDLSGLQRKLTDVVNPSST